VQVEDEPAGCTGCFQNAICCFCNEIVRDIQVADYVDSGAAALVLNLKRVSQRDGLENGPKLVITVGPPVKNPQIQIDFCQRADGNGRHQ
jgi:hypothetical protein